MMAIGRQKAVRKEDEKLSKYEREEKKRLKRPPLTDDYRKPKVIGILCWLICCFRWNSGFNFKCQEDHSWT